jgi:hypothetical protein
MLGAKRRESLKSWEAIDSASVQQGQAIVREREVSNGGRTSSRCCSNIDTRDESITGFNRLATWVPLLDSVAYALKPFVWSEFDFWHGVCTCLL